MTTMQRTPASASGRAATSPAPEDGPRHTRPAWAGVNHLALITRDLDATVRFYDGVLGAPLVATIADEQMRHYFFRFGEHCTVAFFEYANDREARFDKTAGVFDPRSVHFDHLALNLPGEADLVDLQQRLRDAGHEVTDIIDHVAVRSVYFTDPNGIALEASWWVHDPTAVPIDHDGPLFSDPDPVPAVHAAGDR
jgi:catechol 2,3-dioxygenase-like lactoylglutathione lyase family enzyme